MISLAKNQTVSLAKIADTKLTKILIGLGWDPVKKGFFSHFLGGSKAIDLDASVVMLDQLGQQVDCVWFAQLDSHCGALHHRGDNLTGEGDGDDEVIEVNLTRIPPEVKFLAVTVNSYRGQTFNEVDNAFCRVVDPVNHNKEICNYTLKEQGSHTGVVIATFERKGTDWEVTARATPCNGRTIEEMIPTIRNILV